MTTRKIVLIVGAVVVAIGLIVVVFVGGIVGFAIYSVGNSEAATVAKDFLRNSEPLKQEIGDIQDFGSFVTGSINVQNENGAATLNLKVIGARKTVNASVDLAYINGRSWRVSSASYVNERGETVNLLDPYESKKLIPLLVG
jgi:Cytochrome oxidase complex assembly protein 1